MDDKQYLKRIAGISLEVLKDSLHRNRIEYNIDQIKGDKNYFRDIRMHVRASIEKMFENYRIIPSANDASRRFNHEERCIELNGIYNFVVRLNNRPLKIDINYIEIIDRYAKNMGIRIGEMPIIQPKDRIKIYEALK